MSSFNELITNPNDTNTHNLPTDYKKIHNLEAWKEVHRNLSIALVAARDAVDKEQIKRRYLLYEINTNLNEDGTHTDRPGRRRGGTARRRGRAGEGGSASGPDNRNRGALDHD